MLNFAIKLKIKGTFEKVSFRRFASCAKSPALEIDRKKALLMFFFDVFAKNYPFG